MLAALVLILLAQARTELPPVPPPAPQVTPELPPVPPAAESDDSPTAFACSWEIALRGDPCAFEAVPVKGDARTNARLALSALSRACADATADERLRRACEDDGERVARSPSCARDDVRLADDSGRLVQKAGECAEGLRRVLARTRRKAAIDADCLGDDCPPPVESAPPPKAVPARTRAPAPKPTADAPFSDKA